MEPRGKGFTLVELLVVLTIIGLLLGIALKGLVGNRTQRELTGAVDTFASDIRWARSQAAKTGNMVYIAYKYMYDQNQIEPPFGMLVGDRVWDSGVAIPPDNPGINRACKGYIIVEARPRFHQGTPDPTTRNIGALSSEYLFSEWGALGATGVQYATPAGGPYTYRDYLGDLWMADVGHPGQYKRPLEPIYPIDDAATNALLEANVVGRDDSNINRDSIPEVFYPFLLYGDDSSATTYQTTSGYYGDDYQTALRNNDLAFFRGASTQACKVFDASSRDEILTYNVDYASEFIVNPDGFQIEMQVHDAGIDHPRMEDQIIDHVVILRREFPEHVFLMNPHQCKFQVEWNSVSGDEVWEDFQFTQFITAIDPQGRITQREWTFRPEYFPPDSPQNNSDLVHGAVLMRSAIPIMRTVYMVTDDAIEFVGSSAVISQNAAANSEGNGRAYTFWPLVGKYYIDAYPPNDRQFRIPDYDPRLDTNDALSGYGRYISSYGYQRNYLVP